MEEIAAIATTTLLAAGGAVAQSAQAAPANLAGHAVRAALGESHVNEHRGPHAERGAEGSHVEPYDDNSDNRGRGRDGRGGDDHGGHGSDG